MQQPALYSEMEDGNYLVITFNSDNIDMHLFKSLEPLLGRVREIISGGDSTARTALISRDAFPNLLCTRMVKARLEIEYIPLSGLDGLRNSVSAAVRYAENKLRALMGVKSRIAVRDLPEDFQNIIDCYFDNLHSSHRVKIARENKPEYERLYDALPEKMSFEGADEIEKASWGITARLVEGSDEEEAQNDKTEIEIEVAFSAISEETKEAPTDADIIQLSAYDIDILKSAMLKEVNFDLDTGAAAERINELFYGIVGDIVLEISEDEIRLIEDYREDIENWLNR